MGFVRHSLPLSSSDPTHPAEVALSEGQVFAFSEGVVVQNVVVIQQEQLGGILAVALLPTPPQATEGSSPPCRDTCPTILA